MKGCFTFNSTLAARAPHQWPIPDFVRAWLLACAGVTDARIYVTGILQGGSRPYRLAVRPRPLNPATEAILPHMSQDAPVK
ncbi:hypothetical protein SRABI83_01664 [Arthrobacter sp. Bi83]|jgi:hypothetical protein|nr:hypothetical protein SRABI83_01664 [Arthrobacter sp. Bi83]